LFHPDSTLRISVFFSTYKTSFIKKNYKNVTFQVIFSLFVLIGEKWPPAKLHNQKTQPENIALRNILKLHPRELSENAPAGRIEPVRATQKEKTG